MSIRKRASKKAKSGFVYEVFITYKENGITQHYSKRGFTTKKEAEEHEILMKAEIQSSGKLRKESKKTFDEVYNEFLQIGCDKYQYNTIRNTMNMYNMYLQKAIGHYQIAALDYPLLQKYFNSIANGGIAKNKNIKKAINRVLNYAITVGYISSNPVSLVTVKGIEMANNKEKVISLEDFSRIITELESKGDYKHKCYAVALQIGLYTGLRVSEVLALDKADIDFLNNMIYVNKKLNYQGLTKKEFYVTHEMKSKSSNAYIPLADPLKDVLMKWFETNPYEKAICDIDGYYLNPNVFGTDVRIITRKLGIYFHYHMLRHTFATMLVTNKVDIKVAQELMRHSSFNTTMTLYTHINDEKKRTALNGVFNSLCVKNVLNLESENKRLN